MSLARDIALIKFQSTHPARGATLLKQEGAVRLQISIHAPREGCDMPPTPKRPQKGRFQSTHPARGATRNLCFNT